MELDLSCMSDCYLKKHPFSLKSQRTDGLILQLHRSYTDLHEETKRSRFTNICFNYQGTLVAVSDQKGVVFIINLETERYWQLPEVGFPTLISFLVLRNEELLLGLNNTSIFFVHIETGKTTGTLLGHSTPATEISFSEDGYYYLTSNSTEAIVWDSFTYTQIHRLSLKLDVYLKKVLFMPVTNYILACFQDDSMHIWKFGSFECIKQIVPETWKTHNLKSIAMTKNGRAMVIGGKNSNLVVFCLDTWSVRKIIEFPENISGVKQLEFLSQVFDGGANKILVILTTSMVIHFFDIETLIFLKQIDQIRGLSVKFALNSNGKYLASVLSSGEVNIYKVESLLWNENTVPNLDILNQSSGERNLSSSYRRTRRTYELSTVQKQLKEVLNLQKLLPILIQYGEYPQAYRNLIWKTILKLPEDAESFASLSLKKCHQSYRKLELKYPLANKSLSNSLKKLLSNLSHWCPLFGAVDFLPEFAFPFVKLFHPNPLLCFEIVATIIINWCQNWFEFYPFPPINLLSVLESVLGYFDSELFEFYLNNNITSSIFVCPLFHTAFSEVLSKIEWLKLWDHILSNEPSFLFMAIIAYNVVCQNAIRNMADSAEVEIFFHKPSPVDMKRLINKAYHYLKETPADIHPRQFFTPLRPLGSGGTYISFLAYPKLIIDSNVEKLMTIREQEKSILEEQFKALNIKRKLEKKANQHNAAEDKEKIYQKLEEKIMKTVDEEETRLLTEKQKLQNLRQELKLKELEILENTRDKMLQNKIERKKSELERLLKNILNRKNRNKAEVDMMENEIKNYYIDLLLRKCQLQLELGLNNNEKVAVEGLEIEKEKSLNNLNEEHQWGNSNYEKRIDVCGKISIIKSMIGDIEAELSGLMEKNEFHIDIKGDKKSVEELKKEVNTLEREVEMLLKDNFKSLVSLEGQKKQEQEDLLQAKSENLRIDNKMNLITKTKIKKPVKFIKKAVPFENKTNTKKVTTVPRPKTKNSKPFEETSPTELNSDDWGSFVKAASSKLTSAKTKTSRLKSKFTQPTQSRSLSRHSRVNGPFTDAENQEVTHVCEKPKGDFLKKKSASVVGKRVTKKEKSEDAHIEYDEKLSDSADEIFKFTLRARNEMIEKAKIKNVSL